MIYKAFSDAGNFWQVNVPAAMSDNKHQISNWRFAQDRIKPMKVVLQDHIMHK